MITVIFSRAALHDVERLYAFLTPKNPASGKRAVKRIYQEAQNLASMPLVGRKIDDERREWFVSFGEGGYVLRYVIIGSEIVILRIWHSREQRFV